MKRTASTIALLSMVLIAAGGLQGCGGSTLGGGPGHLPTGIGGSTGRGTGGAGAGASPLGVGGFVDVGTAGVVGTGAFGGVVGTGAFGGDIGGSGDPMPCETSLPPVCGALCGNGRRDTCRGGTAPACASVTVTEDCDGTDFAWDGCASAGYLSGNLACTANCTIDFSGCNECAPLDSLLAACGPAPMSFPNVFGLGLAATDSEIGLATVDGEDHRLTFARLSPAFALTSSTAIQEPSLDNSGQVAVAPLPAGWVVAVCSQNDLYIHAFGADGRDLARTEVWHGDGVYGQCTSLALASRPGGGPLLLWQTPDGVIASLVAADGLSVGPQQMISYAIGGYFVRIDAVWAAGAFYAGLAILDNQNANRTLSLMSIQPDGTVNPVRILLPGDLYAGPTLTAGANDLRVVYDGLPAGGIAPSDVGVIWQRLALTGQLASLPAQVVSYYGYSSVRAVAVGDDTVVLLSGGGQQTLSVARVGLDGQIVTPAREIVRGPIVGGDMVRRGSDLVVGWISYDYDTNRLHLARLTP